MPGRATKRMAASPSVGKASMMGQIDEIASVFEVGAQNAQMPQVSNAGPVAVAQHHTNIRKVARHLQRYDGILRSAFSQLGQAVVGTGPVPRTKFRELKPL